jgi:hypothetical protein
MHLIIKPAEANKDFKSILKDCKGILQTQRYIVYDDLDINSVQNKFSLLMSHKKNLQFAGFFYG